MVLELIAIYNLLSIHTKMRDFKQSPMKQKRIGINSSEHLGVKAIINFLSISECFKSVHAVFQGVFFAEKNMIFIGSYFCFIQKSSSCHSYWNSTCGCTYLQTSFTLLSCLRKKCLHLQLWQLWVHDWRINCVDLMHMHDDDTFNCSCIFSYDVTSKFLKFLYDLYTF